MRIVFRLVINLHSYLHIFYELSQTTGVRPDVVSLLQTPKAGKTKSTYMWTHPHQATYAKKKNELSRIFILDNKKEIWNNL